MILKCQYCHNEYEIKRQNYAYLSKRKFCTRKCLFASGHAAWRGKKFPLEARLKMSAAKKGCIPWIKGKKGIIKHTDEWKREASIRSKGSRNPMYGIHINIGADSPRWKGGITTENLLQRSKFRQSIQKVIFERDNYKCQICGNGGDLQVDHIQSWSEFKELRFDPDNCRTLCAKCHYKITFGREMPNHIKHWGHNKKSLGINL